MSKIRMNTIIKFLFISIKFSKDATYVHIVLFYKVQLKRY